MTSNSSTTPSVASTPTITGAHKRNSDDVGWEYGFIPDKSNMERLQCILCRKTFSRGISTMKQHIAHVTGNVSSCPKSTKDDQLKCKNFLNEGKLKKKAKQVHNEGLRVEARQEFHEAENCLGTKAPNVICPMDNYANIINPEEGLKEGKGKNVDLNNIVRKKRILTVHKYISRWAYESAIPFHAFERDSFKMMLEVIGQFGIGLPCPTRYALIDPLLKHEVERTKKLLKKNKKEWKEDGCSIMTDAWSDRKRRSIMNLCVNSKMGTAFYLQKNVLVKHIQANTYMSIVELPRFNKILDQAKKLTIFIYAHHKTLVMMRSYTNKREIILPEVTRFASAFLTLQSLSEKKEQLRHMFSNNEWKECKFSDKPKGIASYKTVTSVQFWSGVTQCLKVFSPLVKVFKMVNADWKPSMGFVYGEIKIAKEEIIKSLGGNEKHYKPIIDIINTKMKGRLDSTLYLTSYLLNPYYHYNDSQLQYYPDVMDAVLEFFDTLFCGDLEKQRQVETSDLPKYKKKDDRFGCDLAIKHCKVNNADFDPASWWGLFGGATPNLTKVAMSILSLTSSSSGCERKWSTFEGVSNIKH
ncbi:unnamed protein product [Lactuca saligna]|uniref:BED-type domain-containing protein n=1 Tax=Lactuca saligna TaxID=75948 RepID=A0AA35V4S0_LACSI|nr:unnamed protein product [Lactuca saligna]